MRLREAASCISGVGRSLPGSPVARQQLDRIGKQEGFGKVDEAAVRAEHRFDAKLVKRVRDDRCGGPVVVVERGGIHRSRAEQELERDQLLPAVQDRLPAEVQIGAASQRRGVEDRIRHALP